MTISDWLTTCLDVVDSVDMDVPPGVSPFLAMDISHGIVGNPCARSSAWQRANGSLLQDQGRITFRLFNIAMENPL